MRWLVVLLAACGGPGNGECLDDIDCSGAVCARNGECLPANEVRPVRVTWTIRGAPASTTTCAPTPNFYILFASSQVNDSFGYEPVPARSIRSGLATSLSVMTSCAVRAPTPLG